MLELKSGACSQADQGLAALLDERNVLKLR